MKHTKCPSSTNLQTFTMLCLSYCQKLFTLVPINCHLPRKISLVGTISVNFLLSKLRGGKIFLQSLVKHNNAISVQNFPPPNSSDDQKKGPSSHSGSISVRNFGFLDYTLIFENQVGITSQKNVGARHTPPP